MEISGLGAADTGDGFSGHRTGSTHQLAMKIGPNSWSPGSDWTLQTSGTNYAVRMK